MFDQAAEINTCLGHEKEGGHLAAHEQRHLPILERSSDGAEHRAYRGVANDWFKPAAVKHRQPRIDQRTDALAGEIEQPAQVVAYQW